ncbi:MAG TPA: quinone-dependent dihydroorotate dehydrogenase [Patescibacteria group bacterium]
MNYLLSQALAWKYQHLIKPLFFLCDPESVHNFMTQIGRALGSNSVTKEVTRLLLAHQNSKLNKTIDGISFSNPVGLSAGFDYNGDLTQILPAVGFGFQTIGTVTWQPYEGNPKPRLGRFPNSKALLVNKGLKSLGAQAIIKELEPLTFEVPIGISIAATNRYYQTTREQMLDILQSFSAFENSHVKHSYYELNISCPNTFGGEPFTSPSRLDLLLRVIDKLKLSRPIYIKMPIDQSEAETLELLNVIDRHQVQGVIIGNLTKDKNSPDINEVDRERWLHSPGNLSGKPTWQRSNNLIALTKKQYGDRFTIIGCGGIFSGEDAHTKMKLGADLVQLITGMIYQGPQLIGQINHYLTITKF